MTYIECIVRSGEETFKDLWTGPRNCRCRMYLCLEMIPIKQSSHGHVPNICVTSISCTPMKLSTNQRES